MVIASSEYSSDSEEHKVQIIRPEDTFTDLGAKTKQFVPSDESNGGDLTKMNMEEVIEYTKNSHAHKFFNKIIPFYVEAPITIDKLQGEWKNTFGQKFIVKDFEFIYENGTKRMEIIETDISFKLNGWSLKKAKNHLEWKKNGVYMEWALPDKSEVTVTFEAHKSNPWGLVLTLSKHWADWSVHRFFEPSQAVELGVKLGWKVKCVNGEQIDESNCESIKKKLSSGKKCEIIFDTQDEEEEQVEKQIFGLHDIKRFDTLLTSFIPIFGAARTVMVPHAPTKRFVERRRLMNNLLHRDFLIRQQIEAEKPKEKIETVQQVHSSQESSEYYDSDEEFGFFSYISEKLYSTVAKTFHFKQDKTQVLLIDSSGNVRPAQIIDTHENRIEYKFHEDDTRIWLEKDHADYSVLSAGATLTLYDKAFVIKVPAHSKYSRWGICLKVEDVHAFNQSRGLFVTETTKKGVFCQKGVEPGMEVVGVNGKSFKEHPNRVSKYMKAAQECEIVFKLHEKRSCYQYQKRAAQIVQEILEENKSVSQEKSEEEIIYDPIIGCIPMAPIEECLGYIGISVDGEEEEEEEEEQTTEDSQSTILQSDAENSPLQ